MKKHIALSLLLTLSASAIEPHGFLDARAGLRLQNDTGQKDKTLAELRLQLDLQHDDNLGTFQFRGDLIYDAIVQSSDIDLENGDGFLDLREANYLTSPTSLIDLKIGRQIITWGTGDLLFINDLFPKDWRSFFTGRDEEYLKAPSDALMLSLFPAWANIDLVYTPRFDADRFIRAERLSFFQPKNAGEINTDQPDDWFQDHEISIRISRNLQGYELALYAYKGFWKSPAGQNPQTKQATFPKLQTYGASLRGTLGQGIINAEIGHYNSQNDRDGNNPTIRNSENRYLIGYQQELAKNLSATLQYYLEQINQYQTYRENLPHATLKADHFRHLITLRLTQQLLSQNLTLGLFTYYSPSDQDAYLRPNIRYKLNDDCLLTLGGNLFFGKKNHTFFGQFKNNNNLYLGARLSF